MLAFHLTAVVSTLLVVLYADEQGFRWFIGRTQTLGRKSVGALHVLVSVGTSLIILTGGLMFIDRSAYLLSQTTFLVKMCFVGALIVNAFFIGSIARLATEKQYAELTHHERVIVCLSGVVSVLGWLGAVACGITLSCF